MFVMPSERDVNPYAPATVIGPETLLTVNRAEPFTTWSTVNAWIDGFFNASCSSSCSAP
jgi:hypothetical protein